MGHETTDDWRKIDSLIEDEVPKSFPGASLAVVSNGEIVHQGSYGTTSFTDEKTTVTDETLFDVASLTKVVCTTSAAIFLHSQNRLPLDTPIAHLDGKSTAGGSQITARRLLSHTTGLPAWRPYHVGIPNDEDIPGSRRELILARARSTEPVHPVDQKVVYSDVGFLILTDLVENLLGDRLDHWCKKQLFSPLGLSNTLYFPEEEPEVTSVHSIASTEILPDIGCLHGEVHDDNARAMGGVAGHAGLFSTALDLALYSISLIRSLNHDDGILKSESVKIFTQRQNIPGGTSRALGWDTPSPVHSSSGQFFSEYTIGHLSFTGCSLWIDLKDEIGVVFLTNRVHPSRANDSIRTFRPVLHDAIRKVLQS